MTRRSWGTLRKVFCVSLPPLLVQLCGVAVAQGPPQDAATKALTVLVRFRPDGTSTETTTTAGRSSVIDESIARAANRLGLLDERLNKAKRLRHVPVLLATVTDARDLDALRRLPGVTQVSLDQRYGRLQESPPSPPSPSPDLDLIGQTSSLAFGSLGTGWNGSGPLVAVLDTGVDHLAFGCSAVGGSCPIVDSTDIAPNDFLTDDASRHGTRVTSVLRRVAPSTGVVAVDVFDGDSTTSSLLLEAVDWIISKKLAGLDIRAANLSVGGGVFAEGCPDVLGFSELVANGITPVASAGNSGNKNGIAFPSCISEAIAVGTVYSAPKLNASYSICMDSGVIPDTVPCFSQDGPGVDMLSPGVDVPADGTRVSGTSFSAPYVAAAIASIARISPTLHPPDIRSILLGTGKVIIDRRTGHGVPRLDLAAALARSTGTVTIAGDGPVRVIDTRSALGGRQGPASTFEFGPDVLSPDEPEGMTSTVAFVGGGADSVVSVTAANRLLDTVIVPAGQTVSRSIFNPWVPASITFTGTAPFHVVLDRNSRVRGIPPESALLKPAPTLRAIRAVRALDTRLAGPGLRPGDDREVSVPFQSGSIFVNVTVTEVQEDGWVSVRPADSPFVEVSSLNVRRGVTTSTGVVMKVGADGDIVVRSSVAAHLVIDVQANTPPKLDATGGDRFTIAPGLPLGTFSSTVDLATGEATITPPGVPPGVNGVLLLLATANVGEGHFSIFDEGDVPDGTSALNLDPSILVSNIAMIHVSSLPRMRVRGPLGTLLQVKVLGWTA